MIAATPLPSPTFRPARASDLGTIETLLTTAGLPTAGVQEIITRDAAQFVVAVDATTGDVVAVAGLEVCCEHALLRSVAVRDDWQRHGLGHELVKRVVCEAEARGIAAVYLLTMTAEHYFPRFGFAPVARDAVPADIASTLEFRSACPASAVAMHRSLDTHAS